ncbi:MAG: MFS transporter [Thiohalocapsa sp.]|jgi:MFS family permease|uniref:MFS transporter n=1 Tax=Thiohalocapsa sp. TaxID=2497641 RepID=UPI0025F73D6A|nr:MFS transporter [Thiohalocapsa sp.]MCG6939745.1 MFS transporter [Thiohalocapsa sp.]
MGDAAASTADAPVAARGRWVGLAFLLGGVLLVAMDQTVVAVVLPRLTADLHIGVDAAAWTVTTFVLVAAVALTPMGQLADHIGRRRLLLLGLLAFALGSLLTALAANLGWLLVGRALQGLVLAALAPAILGLLNLSFPDGPARTLAFALWSTTTASAVAIGPLVGGAFAGLASWRDAFLINPPLCLLVALGVLFFVADDRTAPMPPDIAAPGAGDGAKAPAAGGGLDLPGVLLLGLTMITLVLGLQQGDAWGWWRAAGPLALAGLSPVPWLLAAAVVLALGLLLLERARSRAARPALLAPEILGVASFRVSLIAAGLSSMALYGLVIVLPIYVQFVLGASPLEAGVALCLLGAGMGIGGLASKWLIGRLGRKRLALLALALQIIVLAAMIPTIALSASTTATAALLLPYGMAYSATFSALMNRLLSEVPPALSSRAAGLNATVRLGLAALSTAVMVGVVIGVSVADTRDALIENTALSGTQRATLERMTHFQVGSGAARTDDRQVLAAMAAEPTLAPLVTEVRRGFVAAGRAAIAAAAGFVALGLIVAFRLPPEPPPSLRGSAPGAAAPPDEVREHDPR